jgi:hypothetical protein
MAAVSPEQGQIVGAMLSGHPGVILEMPRQSLMQKLHFILEFFPAKAKRFKLRKLVHGAQISCSSHKKGRLNVSGAP